jgi:hypothetical protein
MHRLYVEALQTIQPAVEAPEPIFWSYLTRKADASVCFGREKHWVTQAGGFVKLGTFHQKRALFN